MVFTLFGAKLCSVEGLGHIKGVNVSVRTRHAFLFVEIGQGWSAPQIGMSQPFSRLRELAHCVWRTRVPCLFPALRISMGLRDIKYIGLMVLFALFSIRLVHFVRRYIVQLSEARTKRRQVQIIIAHRPHLLVRRDLDKHGLLRRDACICFSRACVDRFCCLHCGARTLFSTSRTEPAAERGRFCRGCCECWPLRTPWGQQRGRAPCTRRSCQGCLPSRRVLRAAGATVGSLS